MVVIMIDFSFLEKIREARWCLGTYCYQLLTPVVRIVESNQLMRSD
jgi:hypothetical protein